MLDTGMYCPVILPAVPDSTLVNPSSSATAQRHTLTHKRGHDNNNTYRAVSEEVCCALALDCISVHLMYFHLIIIIIIIIIYTENVEDGVTRCNNFVRTTALETHKLE